LLPDVESGVVRLIGATTHNPFFFVNSPLVSRSQIFELRPLTEEDLFSLLQRALADEERGLGYMKIGGRKCPAPSGKISDGDARKALNSLEIAALTTAPAADGVIKIDAAVAEQSIQKKAVVYDGDGDAHYDTISAFIKSMRGSDPDAALYWLAKMIHAGEDPRFIARRIVICAAEDVGWPTRWRWCWRTRRFRRRNLSAGRKRGFPWPKRRFTLPPQTKATARFGD
jgi:putative ATPase